MLPHFITSSQTENCSSSKQIPGLLSPDTPPVNTVLEQTALQYFAPFKWNELYKILNLETLILLDQCNLLMLNRLMLRCL